MKPVFAFALAAACLAAPSVSLANPPVDVTSLLPVSADEKEFCMRTKGDIGRPGDCLFASYQDCVTSTAAIYAECYRNPRMANGQISKARNRDAR